MPYALAIDIGASSGRHILGEYVNGEIVINPTQAQREVTDLTLTVAGTKEKIAMIEAGANEISNEVMLEAIKTAHVEIQKMCDFIQKMKDEIGKPKLNIKLLQLIPNYIMKLRNSSTTG